MKNKYLEMKLALVEKEINRYEKKELHVEVSLRQLREKQWNLLDELQKEESK